MRVKLKWRIQDSVNVPASGAYQILFTGNSPFDPDFAGSGPTAYLWTQMTNLYDMYMCTYSKIKVYLHCGAAVQNTDMCWIKKPSTQAIPSTPDDYYGQPYGKVKKFYFNALSEQRPFSFSDKCSTTKMLGRKLDPSIDRVPVTTDPTETWEYLLLINNNIAAVKGWYYEAEMTFWVEFSNRKTVGH